MLAYPFPVEPNDPAKHRDPAGPWFDFGNGRFSARPTHSKSGSHCWWVIDLIQAARRERHDGGTLRIGASFGEVMADFQWLLTTEIER